MSDFNRIDRLIKEAHVQRSAIVGEAIGGFLADTWIGVVALGRKAFSSLRSGKPRVDRSKTVAVR